MIKSMHQLVDIFDRQKFAPIRRAVARRVAYSLRQGASVAEALSRDEAPTSVDAHEATWAAYHHHVAHEVATHKAPHKAMAQAIGGNFKAFGVMMCELLKAEGLRPGDSVVDVGCGSGRLAVALAPYLMGPYLGLDVVAALLDYARELVPRQDWAFVRSNGFAIPAADASADFVTFFSVVTHLLHEQSFAYLRDAKRVLRPSGRIVFSFLEFHIPSHWEVFAGNIAHLGQPQHLNQFISRDAIYAWADHLGLTVTTIFDGDKPHIALPHPVTLDDGRVMSGMGSLGQSICVLSKTSQRRLMAPEVRRCPRSSLRDPWMLWHNLPL